MDKREEAINKTMKGVEAAYQSLWTDTMDSVSRIVNPAEMTLNGLAMVLKDKGFPDIAREVSDLADRLDTAHHDFVDAMEVRR